MIRCFPLSAANSGESFSNLHFRFETCVLNKHTQKKIVCFRDIYCPDEATLNALNDVPAPVFKDKIRLKVLVLPPQVPKKKMEAIDFPLLHVIHISNVSSKDSSSNSSGISGLINNLSDKASQQMKGGIIDKDVT